VPEFLVLYVRYEVGLSQLWHGVASAGATTALQNGACTYRCISKQMHCKIPFSHMKSLEIYENYITLFCLEKINFKKYYMNSEPCMAYSQSD
jgi:hypothetical protein